MEHSDPLNGALIEITSAISALNMEPKPIPEPVPGSGPRFLSESDEWAKHCEVHLQAVYKLIAAAVVERDALREEIRFLERGASFGTIAGLWHELTDTDRRMLLETAARLHGSVR